MKIRGIRVKNDARQIFAPEIMSKHEIERAAKYTPRMTSLFTELVKFFSEFTWKKLLSILVMLVIAFIIVSIYELYTSSFRFSRLQKAADLLAKIEEIDSHGTNNAPELEKARTALISQANEAITTKPLTLEFIPTTLKFSMDGVWKFCAGSAFWVIFAVYQLGGIKNPEKRQGFIGTLMVAVITGIAGMFVPSVWWPWFHLFIFPWIFLICLMVVLLPIGYFLSKFAANKKAPEQTN